MRTSFTYAMAMAKRASSGGQTAQHALDVDAALAELACGIEHRVERTRIERIAYDRVGVEHFAQRQALRRGAPTGVRDERMRGIAPDCRRERHLDRFRENLTLGDVEVRAHALRVDLETLHHFRHRGESTSRKQEDVGQR